MSINVKKENGKVVIAKSIPTQKAMTMIDANKRIAELQEENSNLKGSVPNPNMSTSEMLADMERIASTTAKLVNTPNVSTDPKVNAIFKASEQSTYQRELALKEYASLPPIAKKMLTGKELTMDNINYVKRQAEVQTRVDATWKDKITLADWNKGLDAVETKLDVLDQENYTREISQQEARAKLMSQQITTGLSLKAPVYLVDKGYYLLFDNDRVYCQSDGTADELENGLRQGSAPQHPIILGKLQGQMRGSQTITCTPLNPEYIGFEEYKMLLETRPSYQSIRRAYLAIRNDKVLMDFAKATKLFN